MHVNAGCNVTDDEGTVTWQSDAIGTNAESSYV
jgi:hypothetical protein